MSSDPITTRQSKASVSRSSQNPALATPDNASQQVDMSSVAGVVIRRLTSIEEYHAAEEAQRVIWGITDDTEVIPTHLLVTAQKNGGLVLGAFDDRGVMVGFLFGFLGETPDGRVKHCSHMMGVHPDWRGRGLAYALKCAQRDHVMRQGLDLITWTYDPLESVNARLNLGKLGVICRVYLRNIYGELQDSLNVGLPSDRFQVEWWLRARRTRTWLAAGEEWRSLDEVLERGARLVNRVAPGTAGLPAPAGWTPDYDPELLLVEIPPSIQAIKCADMNLAQAWRMETRAIFEACFAAGYAAVHFIFDTKGGERRCFYVLQRGAEPVWTGQGDVEAEPT